MTFQRITANPETCGGKPCIRGLRFPVSRLLGLLAVGETPESILQSYPYLMFRDHPLVDVHRWTNRNPRYEGECFPAQTASTAIR